MSLQKDHVPSELFSELHLAEMSDFKIDGLKGIDTLRAGSDPDARAARASAIEQVRGGKHVELIATALTFKQEKGKSNSRYLRLGMDEDLKSRAARVATFSGQPFLVDHNTYSQSSRKGTILSSELVQETANRVAFRQQLQTVKPDAVISILDGTLDRFSIGWYPGGRVLCTVHGKDILSRDSCHCWPGERVELDGQVKIVEYEFIDWRGKETSGVNIPAVEKTSIEQVRAALAAELSIPSRRTTPKEQQHMALIKLAAALSLTSLGEADEDRAVAAVESMRARALSAENERASLLAEKAQMKTALSAALQAASLVKVNTVIEKAYRDGKLMYGRDEEGNATPSPREVRLRRIGSTPETGLSDLEAELKEMPIVAPINARQPDGAKDPPPSGNLLGAEPEENPYLAQVAETLGLDVKDMQRFKNGHILEGGF